MIQTLHSTINEGLFNMNNFSPKEDAVILDAIEYGHLSHARVQMLLKSNYSRAAIFVDNAVRHGYFDKTQHPLITKTEYQKIIQRKRNAIPPR